MRWVLAAPWHNFRRSDVVPTFAAQDAWRTVGPIAMGLDLRLQHKMAQQLVMTPQLQQAIKLLQLSHMEVAQALREELAQNPLLEELEPGSRGSTDAEAAASLDASAAGDGPPTPQLTAGSAEAPPELAAAGTDAVALAADLAALSTTYAGSPPARADLEPPPEAADARPATLWEHLAWQLRMADLAGPERAAALYLAQEIDEDGYLPGDALAGCAADLGVNEAQLARALACVQALEPAGVGARDLRECLLLQARAQEVPDALLLTLLESHLPALERRSYAKIARALGCDLAEVTQAVRRMAQLEPRPGRAFAEVAPQYIVPDLYVHHDGQGDTGLHVSVNEEGLPKLCLSPHYAGGSAAISCQKTRSYLQEKRQAASFLLRSVYMRQRTMVRVMHSILKFQRAFFLDDKPLRPLVLREVAQDLGMHESTVSRVTSGKYVHTPKGTFELKFFFSSTLRGCDGEEIGSESVRHRIMQLIDREDKNEPLSDQKIVELLRGHDIAIARRTVAKYRKMLNKQPSSARRRDF